MAMLFKYPASLGSNNEDEGNHHIITFVALKYNENRGKDSLGDEVNLYITGDALKSTYGQTYADVGMGAVGGFLMQAQGAEKIYGAMEGAVGSLAGGEGVDIASILSKVSRGGQTEETGSILSTALVKGQMQQIRKGVAGAFPGAIEALDAKRGAVMNPHKALVYQGPGGFRTFTFTYKFSPASLKEAKSVANIVYFFKYHMHPSMDQNASNVGETKYTTSHGSRQHGRQAAMFKSINLKYPDEFLLEIRPRSKPQKDKLGEPKQDMQTNPLFRIDRCFLETCVVDYSTDGVPAFFQKHPNDGDQAYPVTTTLNLAFKETKILTREDIVEGY